MQTLDCYILVKNQNSTEQQNMFDVILIYEHYLHFFFILLSWYKTQSPLNHEYKTCFSTFKSILIAIYRKDLFVSKNIKGHNLMYTAILEMKCASGIIVIFYNKLLQTLNCSIFIEIEKRKYILFYLHF